MPATLSTWKGVNLTAPSGPGAGVVSLRTSNHLATTLWGLVKMKGVVVQTSLPPQAGE